MSPPIQLEIQRAQLDNGLRVVLHRDTTLPLVSVNLWYHVGSKNERPGRTGFAHLFEHMLFQGSEHVEANEHFAYVQQVGGSVNGSTWYDRTNYYETVPAEHLDLALWLESDRMGFFLPALTSENLEKQRSVVMNERRQRVDNRPYGRAYERLNELLYPDKHPYHWPVIGYMDDIAAATLEEVQEFFRTYYHPANAVLTLAGDFEPEAALASIERYFGPLKPGPVPVPVRAPLPPLDGERREELPDDVELPRMYLAYQAPPFGQRGWYAADLLATALAGGKSSPLYKDLVYDRRLAQEIGAYVVPTEIASSFTVVATCRPGVQSEELEAAVSEHLRRAAAEPLPETQVERARNQALTGYYRALETLDRRADLLSELTTFFDDPHRLATEAQRYRELSAQDLLDYAAGHWSDDERVVLTVVPQSDQGGQATPRATEAPATVESSP